MATPSSSVSYFRFLRMSRIFIKEKQIKKNENISAAISTVRESSHHYCFFRAMAELDCAYRMAADPYCKWVTRVAKWLHPAIGLPEKHLVSFVFNEYFCSNGLS